MPNLELSVNSICKIVSEEKYGFKFGKPDRPSAESLSCILPILRKTAQVRQYVTYPESDQVLVHDSGSINKVNLLNSSKENVFVRSGTIESRIDAQRGDPAVNECRPAADPVRGMHAAHIERHRLAGIEHRAARQRAALRAFALENRSGPDENIFFRGIEQAKAFRWSPRTGAVAMLVSPKL